MQTRKPAGTGNKGNVRIFIADLNTLQECPPQRLNVGSKKDVEEMTVSFHIQGSEITTTTWAERVADTKDPV